MTEGPAKKEEHQAEGKKKEIKKPEIVPIEKLIDALQEGAVTTITEVAKHMDVYGDAKPKIEEVLKETAKIEGVLRTLPRKKATPPGTKVKPNPEEIERIREVIGKFLQYVEQMRRSGETFRADFGNLKTMEEGARKTEAALVLSSGMMGTFKEIKGVNAQVQAILKNEQYGFVPDSEQDVFEEALVIFFNEFVSFAFIVNYALRYSVTKEEEKKTIDAARKAVLDELKAIADVSEKNVDKFKTKKKEIAQQIKNAKDLEDFIKQEERAELEKLKLLQQKAEPIIKAIKDEIQKLIGSIKKQDKAFAAFGDLETITVKELKDLKEIPAKINAEVGKIKAAAEQLAGGGMSGGAPSAAEVKKLNAIIEASKKEIKAQLDAFKSGISMEKTMGRREVISLNTVVNSTQEIVTIATQIEDTLKDKLIAFLQTDEGKKAFPGDRIHNATTAALGDINKLQTIIIEEQDERNMIGTVGRVMRERAQKEEVVRGEIDRIKKNDAIFKDNTNLITQMPRIASALSREINEVANAEQALVNALQTSKDTANKIKTQVADVQKTLAEVEALLPAKGFFANLFKRFRR